jgi:hypothetical protein
MRNLELALQFLGYRLPKTRLEMPLASLTQAVIQIWRRVVNPRLAPLEPEEAEKRLEVTRACERLTHIAWFESELNAILFLVFFPLNLAESAGSSPDLARIHANAAIGLSLSPIPAAADYHLRKGIQMAQSQNDPYTLGRVLEYAGVYHLGRGEWAQAEETLQKASQVLGEAEFHRQWEESTGLLAEMKYLRGDFEGRSRSNSRPSLRRVSAATRSSNSTSRRGWR